MANTIWIVGIVIAVISMLTEFVLLLKKQNVTNILLIMWIGIAIMWMGEALK